MKYLARALGLSLVGLSITACVAGDTRSDEEETAERQDAIVNGSTDSAHPAVVAWYANSFKCSATIISVNGSTGWALSAGHCVGGPLGQLRQGVTTGGGNADVVYPIQEVVLHPHYNEAPLLDFALIRFSGATAATPVIPAMLPTQDTLAAGNQLTMVGYGATSGSGGGTGTRRFKDIAIESVSELTYNFDQFAGGQCSGDSGGAAIVQVGGVDRLAGVISRGEIGCLGFSTDVRVSTVYNSFILPTINGTALGNESCGVCQEAVFTGPTVNDSTQGICFPSALNCFDPANGQSAECNAYIDCINGCTEPLGCLNACGASHPAGEATYDGLVGCLCGSGCGTECSSAGFCNASQCGIGSPLLLCDSCIESNCCAQSQACDGDASCKSCFPDCAGNANADALLSCLTDNCATGCGLDGGGGAGGGGVGGGINTDTGIDTGTGTGIDASGGAGGKDTSSNKSDPEDDGGCSLASPVGGSSSNSTWLLGALSLALVLVRRHKNRA